VSALFPHLMELGFYPSSRGTDEDWFEGPSGKVHVVIEAERTAIVAWHGADDEEIDWEVSFTSEVPVHVIIAAIKASL
jgi:hypothetical protein